MYLSQRENFFKSARVNAFVHFNLCSFNSKCSFSTLYSKASPWVGLAYWFSLRFKAQLDINIGLRVNTIRNVNIFCRSHLTPNKTKQAEAKKNAASLAVEDLRVAVVKGNTSAIQKYLDDGKIQILLSCSAFHWFEVVSLYDN